MKNLFTPSEARFFLVSQADLDKIDALTGALNLAITEILEGRPVRDHREERMDAQLAYDELTNQYLYPDSADRDPRQVPFPF